jgi:hypothetical protein
MTFAEHALKNGSYYHIISRGLSTEVDMALTFNSQGDTQKLSF